MPTIKISIDAMLLDKARFKDHVRKNGKKALFIELVLIETPNSEYGDYIVKQDVTKEERETKKEMPILGNGKVLGGRTAGGGDNRRSTSRPASSPKPESDDDVPF